MEAVKKRKLNEDKRIEDRQPLRVLLICSQPLLDDGHSLHLPDVKDERSRIVQIFNNSNIAVKLHVLPEATYSEIALSLQKSWDVIHYTGI